jgi:hypothetical protein
MAQRTVFLITIMALTIPFSLTGCLDKLKQEPDKNEQSLGQPASSDDIWAAITRPFENVDLTKVKVGEKNFYEINQQIQNSAPRVMGYEENEVISRSEDTVQKIIQYVIRKTSYSYENGVLKPSVSEEAIAVNNASATAQAKAMAFMQMASPMSLGQVRSNSTTAFYNLSVSAANEVLNFESCQGCNVLVNTIKFDYVVTRPGEAPYKQIHKLRFSADLPAFDYPLGEYPFYSGVLDYCVSALEPYEGTQVFVSACNVLKDFKR